MAKSEWIRVRITPKTYKALRRVVEEDRSTIADYVRSRIVPHVAMDLSRINRKEKRT